MSCVYDACTKVSPLYILWLINLVLSARVGKITAAAAAAAAAVTPGEWRWRPGPARRAHLAENVAI